MRRNVGRKSTTALAQGRDGGKAVTRLGLPHPEVGCPGRGLVRELDAADALLALDERAAALAGAEVLVPVR